MNKLENRIEVVTITNVSGRNVSYNSEFFDGCDVSNFPQTPLVGQVWKIYSNWGKISKTELVEVGENDLPK